MGKHAFYEDYQHPDADPSMQVQFDYAEVSARLGEIEQEVDREVVCAALAKLLKWVLDTPHHKRGSERIVARRILALGWAVDPSYLAGSPSLTQLAGNLGIAKSTLSALTADASKTFNTSNTFQVHDWRKKAPR